MILRIGATSGKVLEDTHFFLENSSILQRRWKIGLKSASIVISKKEQICYTIFF